MKKTSKVLAGVLSCALALVCVVGLSACGDEGTEQNAGGKKVAMVLNAPVNDGGWCASCYDAMKIAADKAGWQTAYSESVPQADWISTYQSYVDQDYDLIIAPGNEYVDAVKQVATDNPDARFCIFNADVSDVDNIECTAPDTAQIGQIAGVLAGLMTKTNNVGFIGGVELDTTIQKIDGFTEAAKKVNPDCEVATAFAGSFSDAAKGKELANSMLNNKNCDVLFGDASIVDTGAREAVAAAGEGHYDIGQPSDLGSADDQVIINSVVTDMSKMCEQVLNDVDNDTFGKKTVVGNLENDCVHPGTMSNIVPEDVQKLFAEYLEQIKNGQF